MGTHKDGNLLAKDSLWNLMTPAGQEPRPSACWSASQCQGSRHSWEWLPLCPTKCFAWGCENAAPSHTWKVKTNLRIYSSSLFRPNPDNCACPVRVRKHYRRAEKVRAERKRCEKLSSWDESHFKPDPTAPVVVCTWPRGPWACQLLILDRGQDHGAQAFLTEILEIGGS